MWTLKSNRPRFKSQLFYNLGPWISDDLGALLSCKMEMILFLPPRVLRMQPKEAGAWLSTEAGPAGWVSAAAVGPPAATLSPWHVATCPCPLVSWQVAPRPNSPPACRRPRWRWGRASAGAAPVGALPAGRRLAAGAP